MKRRSSETGGPSGLSCAKEEPVLKKQGPSKPPGVSKPKSKAKAAPVPKGARPKGQTSLLSFFDQRQGSSTPGLIPRQNSGCPSTMRLGLSRLGLGGEEPEAQDQKPANKAAPTPSPRGFGDDGFTLHFSQDYARRGSQAVLHDDDEEEDSQEDDCMGEQDMPSTIPVGTVPSQQQQVMRSAQGAQEEVHLDASQPCSLPQQSQEQAAANLAGTQAYGPALGDLRVAAPVPALVGPQKTPTLAAGGLMSPTCTNGQQQGDAPVSVGKQQLKMFNVFKPQGQCKYLCVIRHGESEYNAAVSAQVSGFKDPNIFDPNLTAKGRMQAQRLRPKLADKLAKYEEALGPALWVVSPLSRALQTFLEACPCLDRLAAAEAAAPAPARPGPPQRLQSFGSVQPLAEMLPAQYSNMSLDSVDTSLPPTLGPAGGATVGARQPGSGSSAASSFANLGQLLGHQRSSSAQQPMPFLDLTGDAAVGPSRRGEGEAGPSRPSPYQAGARGAGASGSGARQAGSSPAVGPSGSGQQGPAQPQVQPLKLEVLSTISEFLVTPGDVGRPASVLQADFPELKQALSKLPEQWWFTAAGKRNCALTKSCEALEPASSRTHRVAEFCRWLNSRPERLIILVGHCSFWGSFLKGRRKDRMANGELFVVPDW